MWFISKQLVCQRFIYKIHSSRLRKERWKLTLPIDEARKNDEVISLADSQMLRWIDELNGITDADRQAAEIKEEIKRLRRSESGPQTKREIKKLYRELDALQFKPDYMCLIIDREKDYWRACKGFSINGIKYKRLLGTNGGIKNSTIVFVSERLSGELRRRIDNGRDLSQKLVPAKLEAYKALTCSASTPVSWPNGILVVRDFETVFHEDTIYLTDENDGEPDMELQKDTEIHLNGCDGCGLMLPSLAARWSEELGLDYVMGGCNTRLCWEKGMVFAFDFLDFAENVAHRYIVEDIWGNEVDIRQVELIFTESMLKIWNGYKSIDHYLACCHENKYSVCVTKVCPKALENERMLNYQFIQSYELSDDDIDELIAPTVQDIHDALGGDWRKAVLFLRGKGITENNVDRMENDFVKAIMIDDRMLGDPFVQNNIYQLIRNRINEAKVGVLNVHGNYSIVSGDPYALCQSVFGMQVTGLLKGGEIYNRYWADSAADELVCFRAPMSVHNNIRKVYPCRTDEAAYWYRYNPTGTIFNVWDTATAAMNGMDFDGDLVMLTDNPVLVKRHKSTPSIMCVQRRAEKTVPTEEQTVCANIAAFGNDIGRTTNWVTSMYEVQAKYAPGSIEYEELAYRTKVGQLIQQNVIDRAKGIVAKPMPREWHDRHEANRLEDTKMRELYKRIVADRKPYFMRYIYPALMKQYNTYMKNTDRNALREFGESTAELERKPCELLTDRQAEFLRRYRMMMPVGVSDCVMNRICRRIEKEFDGYVRRQSASNSFDYRIMMSGAEYTPRQYTAVRQLYEDYTKKIAGYTIFANYERVDECDAYAMITDMDREFRRECAIACPDERALCNIVLDLCYRKKTTKRFAWNMCGETIIQNLLDANDQTIRFPTEDENGEIQYGGERFTVQTKRIEVDA